MANSIRTYKALLMYKLGKDEQKKRKKNKSVSRTRTESEDVYYYSLSVGVVLLRTTSPVGSS